MVLASGSMKRRSSVSRNPCSPRDPRRSLWETGTGDFSEFRGRIGYYMSSDFTSYSDRVSSEFLLSQALEFTGEARNIRLTEAAEALRLEMEELGLKLKDLILSQDFEDLLGYLWGNILMGLLNDPEGSFPDDLANQRGPIQLALEYLHAVASCFDAPSEPETEFDEAVAAEVIFTAERLREVSLLYCLASSHPKKAKEFGDFSGEFEYKAKTSWLIIRSNRYQVLEEQFFNFVLEPHGDALRRAYGVGAAEVAAGIQAIADSMREGFARTTEEIDKHREAMPRTEDIERIRQEKPEVIAEIKGLFQDLFYGGLCNLSRHTLLPESLLADLSFEPGENVEFFAPGPLCGTPFRTLPARIKPLVNIRGSFYATDPNFVRDAAYRAIKRGLGQRIPEYREEWNQRQKTLTECAFQRIFERQFAGAQILNEVYYETEAGRWVENDTLIILEDVLLLVEAKGGIGAMSSPAENFSSHVRAVQNLVIKAYRQAKRFFDYLASSSEVPLFEQQDGEYIPIRSLRLADFRLIVSIGLTVESFSPFSTMCKELPGIEPLLGRHPFISMSIDDCFVLSRFLPTTGEFFHYLAVRQQVAGIRGATLFDELDHLGAYIAKNRFDLNLREQLSESAPNIAWEGFSREVDQYFEGDRRRIEPPPRQSYPGTIERLLAALANTRAPGWLKMDAYIRDFGETARVELARVLDYLSASLKDYSKRWYLLDADSPLLIWISIEAPSDVVAMVHQAEITALAMGLREAPVLRISATRTGEFIAARCIEVPAPPLVRIDYQELIAKADLLRARVKHAGVAALPRNPNSKLRPNEVCWCGSGRKFKKCHGLRKRVSR